MFLGIERLEIKSGINAVNPLGFVHCPWSHSLVALAAWGAALGVASHRPDMPISPVGILDRSASPRAMTTSRVEPSGRRR